jgi:hypothetical protein
MFPACPKCGAVNVRLSHTRRALRKIRGIFGIYHFRCEDCGHAFRSNIHRLALVFYARCQSCDRMDLSRWTREFYQPNWLTRTMLALGAKPIRCEYCRNNFWSFRLVREKFSRAKRIARSHVVTPVEPDSEGNIPSGRPVN